MFGDIRTRLWLTAGLLVALVAAGWGYAALADRFDPAGELAALDAALAAEDWPRAESELAAVRARWRRARTVFELNYGADLMIFGERALERLGVSIAAREAAPARVELADLGALWRWLTMPVPDGR